MISKVFILSRFGGCMVVPSQFYPALARFPSYLCRSHAMDASLSELLSRLPPLPSLLPFDLAPPLEAEEHAPLRCLESAFRELEAYFDGHSLDGAPAALTGSLFTRTRLSLRVDSLD